jgi:para-aminobenzoate synthetase
MAPYSRVLIVDNYDSFTYNLEQAFQVVTGFSPSVIKNDDEAFMNFMQKRNLSEHFDVIVLSPGPGHPRTDIGDVTAKLLSYYFDEEIREKYPVLFGVCMGYEAIGVKLGVDLVKTVPRHGNRSLIEIDPHFSCPLFEGLPSYFKQVRYHSLILDSASLERCESLIVTSRCWDLDPTSAASVINLEGPALQNENCPGWLRLLSQSALEFDPSSRFGENQIAVPMSFRHQSLPVFGVQFHPESILSEHGDRIIANVCKVAGIKADLIEDPPATNGSLRRNEFSVITSNLFEVPIDDLPEWTIVFFEKMFYSDCKPCVWLDSPSGSSGRWSFFAGGNIEESLFSVYEQRGNTVRLSYGRDLNIEFLEGKGTDSLNVLTYWISDRFGTIESLESVPISVPCVFPILGYESSRLSEVPSDDVDAAFVVTDRVLAVDNTTGKVLAIHKEGDIDWLKPIKKQIGSMNAPIPQSSKVRTEDCPLFKIRDCKSCYLDKIRTCQLAIEQGESYELCLTTQIEGTLEMDTLQIYKSLRSLNPAHYSCFIQLSSQTLLMASPERLLKVDGKTGIAQVKPIKGTRRRGNTQEEDEAIRQELASSEKDFSENLMIVDLVRNDLSTVCSNVNCPTLMKVETYAPYHQLVSTVEGRLDDPKRLAELVGKVFPAGSMTGAPKIRSMQILAAIEGQRRGLGYSGAVGYICPRSGDADLAVTIRSILYNKDTRKVSIGCGGAILAISDPEEEWKEILVKAKRTLQVIAHAKNARGVCLEFSDRSESIFIRTPTSSDPTFVTTMRYEEDRGIWLFRRHIKRLCMYTWDKVSFEDMKTAVLSCIRNESMRQDTSLFETFREIEDGPFLGISGHEWESVQPSLGVRACRIRIEVQFGSDLQIRCCMSPLNYENPTQLHPSSSRVESSDSALRLKTPDWFVPSNVSRESTLLVNELGYVTETGISNIAFLKDRKWITPALGPSYLIPGTLRELLIDHSLLAEGLVHLDEVRLAGGVFCFNGVRGCYRAKLA